MQKPTHINRKPLYAAVIGGVFAVSASTVVIADAVNPTAAQNPLILAASCNPCNPVCGEEVQSLQPVRGQEGLQSLQSRAQRRTPAIPATRARPRIPAIPAIRARPRIPARPPESGLSRYVQRGRSNPALFILIRQEVPVTSCYDHRQDDASAAMLREYEHRALFAILSSSALS